MSGNKNSSLVNMRKFVSFFLAISFALMCGCNSQNSTIANHGKITAFSSNITELDSNRFTKAETPNSKKDDGASLDGFCTVLENENFVCYYKESVCGIRILDKRNGYVWGCVEEEKPEGLNKKWSCYANSVVAVEYSTDGSSTTVTGASKKDLIYSVKNNKVEFKANFIELGISFNFDLILTDYGFKFSVEPDSVKETKTKIVSVSFVPYFGSVKGNEKNGYMFIPDGCGALIRFNAPRNYLEGFSKRIYGADYGIDNLQVINDLGAERINTFEAESKSVSMPVFGMTHGTKQNSYLAIVENGDEYCKINSEPAGIITDYNRTYASFIYRSSYEQPINKKSSGVYTLQNNLNSISPVISYHLLTDSDADYVGMAKTYRKYLSDKKILTKIETDKRIPLRLDFIISDVKKNFLGSSVKTVTEISEIVDMINYLNKSNSVKTDANLLGWQKGGLHGYTLTDGNLGVQDTDINSLKTTLNKNNGSLKYFVNLFSGTEKQFASQSDYAITMSQNIATLSSNDENLYLSDRHFLKPNAAIDNFKSLDKKSQYVFSDYGNMLFGEYLQDKFTNRQTVYKKLIDSLGRNEKYTFVEPNAYLYKYTSNYYNSTAVCSQYVYETDTVPFTQIVLSGYMNIFSQYLNCSMYSLNDVLKLIDYNIYPSFILTGVENYDLRNTASADLQSSRISDWQEYISDTYKTVNSVLSKIAGKCIVDRTVIKTGFVKTDYENGSVFVNYTDKEQNYSGIVVSPQSAVFVDKEAG